MIALAIIWVVSLPTTAPASRDCQTAADPPLILYRNVYVTFFNQHGANPATWYALNPGTPLTDFSWALSSGDGYSGNGFRECGLTLTKDGFVAFSSKISQSYYYDRGLVPAPGDWGNTLLSCEVLVRDLPGLTLNAQTDLNGILDASAIGTRGSGDAEASAGGLTAFARNTAEDQVSVPVQSTIQETRSGLGGLDLAVVNLPGFGSVNYRFLRLVQLRTSIRSSAGQHTTVDCDATADVQLTYKLSLQGICNAATEGNTPLTGVPGSRCGNATVAGGNGTLIDLCSDEVCTQYFSSDLGEKIYLMCSKADLDPQSIPSFTAWYVPEPGSGQPVMVGVCPWKTGCNTFEFRHTGDKNGNGIPDCFTKLLWVSKDYGANDENPNPWMDQVMQIAYDEPAEGLLDWAITEYDVCSGEKCYRAEKHTYATPPWINCPQTVPPEGELVESFPCVTSSPAQFAKAVPTATPVTAGTTSEEDSIMATFQDPLLDTLLANLRGAGDEESGWDTHKDCDLNWDGICDSTDRKLFAPYLGTCAGDGSPLSKTAAFTGLDDNLDRCIDSTDEASVFGPRLGCQCQCFGDPACDGVKSDVFDIVLTIAVAFRDAAPSKVAGCPFHSTDVNCDGVTNIFDVVKMINVAFRGESAEMAYCYPCAG